MNTLKEANHAFKILGVTKSEFLELPATMIGNVLFTNLTVKL